MADYGLLLSMAATLYLPAMFTRWRTLRTTDGHMITDVALSALGVGLLVGRIVSLAIDDPRSLTRLGDFLIIRSGVEFWAGVAAGLVVVIRAARRDQVHVADRLADITPAALVGQAGYYLTCVVRDGCYGPDWRVGPTPKGMSHGTLPVELLGSAALVAVAVMLSSRRVPSLVATLAGLTSLASARAVTSIWLPRLGAGITRQHTTSIIVAIASLTGLAAVVAATRRRNEDSAAAAPLRP